LRSEGDVNENADLSGGAPGRRKLQLWRNVNVTEKKCRRVSKTLLWGRYSFPRDAKGRIYDLTYKESAGAKRNYNDPLEFWPLRQDNDLA